MVGLISVADPGLALLGTGFSGPGQEHLRTVPLFSRFTPLVLKVMGNRWLALPMVWLTVLELLERY